MPQQEQTLNALQHLQIDVAQLRDRVQSLEILNRILLVVLAENPEFQSASIHRGLYRVANQMEDDGQPLVADELDVLRDYLRDVLLPPK